MFAAPMSADPTQTRAALEALRIRAREARSATPVLADPTSERLVEELGLDPDGVRLPRSMVLGHGVRAAVLDRLVRDFARRHPDAVVVDLGCGLDDRRRRCATPPGVDWYVVDLPEVIRLREAHLPDDGRRLAADVTSPGWLDALPRDRPAVVVSDGIMAFLTGPAFVATVRALTGHLARGELVFNAYSRLALRNARRVRGGVPTPGEGIDDPREPETWQAGLELVEELSIARAPEVDRYPPVLRAVTRLASRSRWMVRVGDRVVRYRFPV